MVYGKVLSEATYIDILNEAIDMDTGEGGIYRPVFIVLSYCDTTFDRVLKPFVKNEIYWHSAIGFGPSLKYLYSFNFGEFGANPIKGGLSFESIEGYQEEHPNADIFVGCILLDDVSYIKLKDALLHYFVNKKKTRYSLSNVIVNMKLGIKKKDKLRMDQVCSSFIDAILKYADIDLTNMPSNLVRPDHLIKDSDNYYKIYQGKIDRYDPIKTRKMIENMADNESYSFFSKSIGYAS